MCDAAAHPLIGFAPITPTLIVTYILPDNGPQRAAPLPLLMNMRPSKSRVAWLIIIGAMLRDGPTKCRLPPSCPCSFQKSAAFSIEWLWNATQTA
jgi:hypothetical protein